ncbi:hypothetical protein YC2023_115511 [Brassica napus]
MKLQLLCLVLVFIAVETNAAKQGKNATISALIVFGDSIMDTGNNNRLPTLLKCNFPPYGKDFPGGLATGRFSDGRVPSDLIAEKLGIAKSLPAFMNPNLKPQDLLKGVTFASGGTGYDPLTAQIMELHKLGAKKIGVFSAVPVGCVPLQRTVFGGMFTRGCVKPLNNMAKQFNARLSPALESLDKELDGVILYIDVYDTLYNMIQHPSKYGFEVADRGCCGRGSLAISYMSKQGKNATIPALIVFGDSIMDTGNNNRLPTLLKCNFPPYGKDFPGGLATGRFSDGRVPSDLIAEKLGIAKSLPAFMNPNLKPQDLLKGVTFASGGTGYDPLTAKIMSVISVWDQLTYFKRYISTIKQHFGEKKAQDILDNSFFVVCSSSNDLAHTFMAQSHKYDPTSYANFLADSAVKFELHKLGAKKIGVFSAVPVGCVPLQRTVFGGMFTRGCVESLNNMAKQFNARLSPALESLDKELDGVILYIDVYDTLFDMIQHPSKYEDVAVGALSRYPICATH